MRVPFGAAKGSGGAGRSQRPERPDRWSAASGILKGRLVALSASSAGQAAANGIAALVATIALGAQERGVMVLGLTIGSLIGLVGGLGTGASFRSLLPTVSGDARRRFVCAYTWVAIAGSPCAAAVAALVTLASAPMIDPELGRLSVLLAVAAYTVSQVLLTQMVDGWFADGHFRRGSAAAAMMSIGGLLGVLVALMFSSSAAVLLTAQAVGVLIVCVVQIPALRRAELWDASCPARPELKTLLRRGVPALGVSMGMAVVGRADRYLLGAASGAAAVGIYSLAATLSEMPRLLPTALGQIVYRDVAVDSRSARVRRMTLLAIAAAAAGAAVVMVGGLVLIVPVFGPEFADARGLLFVLLVAEIAFAPYSVATRGLLGGGWTKVAGATGIGAGIGAVVIYAVAADLAGGYGVAAASIALYGALSATTCGLLRRRLRRRADTEASS